MALPDQNIPEAEKTEKWIQHCVRHIKQQIDSQNWSRERDQQCRAIWNGEVAQGSHDYLRKYGDNELPAFVRFIPILRPKGERLMGEYTERPFQYTIFGLDDDTTETAMDMAQHSLIEGMRAKLFDRYSNIIAQKNQIDQLLAQSQQSQQQAVQGAQGGNGQLVQDPHGATQMVIPPAVAQKMAVYKSLLEQQGVFSEEEMKKLQAKLPYSNLQMHELLMTNGLEFLRYTQALEKKFYDGFENKLVTDKAIFLVDWDNPYEDPYLKGVNTDHFYYAADNEIDFVQEADWQALQQNMSVGHIINQFRYEISPSTLARLEAKRKNIASGYTSWVNSNAWNSTNGLYSYGTDMMANCKVTRAWFRSPRAVHWKKTPNKYLPGKFHDHLIDETDVPPLNERKPEETYETFWMDDIYEGVLVDDNEFIRCRKKPVVLRSRVRYGQVSLPCVGIAYLSKNRRPHSRVWASKDLQALYNLMHFHTELYLAVSGPRGMVMDRAQKPAGMSDTEWMYQKKLGTAWIESFKNGRSFAFNQFKTYDDSPGEGIMYIEKIKESLDSQASRVWGVSDARQGETSPQDKVGTMERSIRQSTLTTEPIYWEMEMTKRMALERLINLCRLAWRKGRKGAFVNPHSLNRMILNIPPGALLAGEYGLYIKDGGKEMRLLDTIRQLSITEKGQGRISLSQLISIFSTDSLIKLKGMAEEYEKLQQEAGAQLQQAEQEGQERVLQVQAELDAKLLELENNLKAELQKSSDQLKMVQAEVSQAGVQLNEDKLQFEKQVKQIELQQNEAKIQGDIQTKVAGIESERFTEFAYLDEQRRQFDIEHGSEQDKDAEKIAKKMEQNKKGGNQGVNQNPASDGRTSTKNSSKEKVK